MVLLAPKVTALHTLLEVRRAYAGRPHDIVYNTTKTVCMLIRPKQCPAKGIQDEEFRYLGHVMTADWRYAKDIKKTIQEAKCSWQYADH